MPRKTGDKQISCTVTAAQHRAYLAIAAALGIRPCELLRALLASEAQRLGIEWADELRPYRRNEKE